MKKLFKLFSLFQAARGGYGAKPWKGGRNHHQAYGQRGGPGYGYGQRRPRGMKGMLVEAVMSRLFRR